MNWALKAEPLVCLTKISQGPVACNVLCARCRALGVSDQDYSWACGLLCTVCEGEALGVYAKIIQGMVACNVTCAGCGPLGVSDQDEQKAGGMQCTVLLG